MKKLVLLLLLLAPAQALAFTYDGGTLPDNKVDKVVDPYTPTNKKIVAAEWNSHTDATMETRDALVHGLYHGFSFQLTPPSAPLDGVRLFSLDGGAGSQPTLNYITPNGTVTTLGAGGGGGGSPGGSDGAVQFNSSGAFGGDSSNFAYDSLNHRLRLGVAADDGTGSAAQILGVIESKTGGFLDHSSSTNSLPLLSSPSTGSSVNRFIQLVQNSDINNSPTLSLGTQGSAPWVTQFNGGFLISGKNGTGTTLPLYLMAHDPTNGDGTYRTSDVSLSLFANNNRVGINTTTDDGNAQLQVNGTVESKSGGFMFPNGTVQNTAAQSWSAPVAASLTCTSDIATNDYVPGALLSTVLAPAAGNMEACMIASGSLSATGVWAVTVEGYFNSLWTASYPSFGVAVATSMTGTGYGSYTYMNNNQHTGTSTFTMGGARISAMSFSDSNSQYALASGGEHHRLIADGTALHYQVSADGIEWWDIWADTTPAGLGYYGFALGQDYTGGGATGYPRAVVTKVALTTSIPTFTITGATNASPIVITTSAAHGFMSGDVVSVHGVVGNTNANNGIATSNAQISTWTIKVLSSTTFQLLGSTGNGAYTSGGTVTLVGR